MAPIRKVKPKKDVEVVEEEAEKPVENEVVSGQLAKKLRKLQKKQIKKDRGIVFIKHLPHGFFEEQLKNYFEQFGNVTRLRLVRSRRTGGSKGYAFVEFEYPEVAQVAAETMDNYLMFQRLVKAAYIPPDKQLYNYFKSTVRKVKNKAGKTIFVSSKTAAIQRKVKQHNDWSEKKCKEHAGANLRKIKKLNEKYAHLGIDFSSICLGPKVVEDANATSSNETEVVVNKRKSSEEVGQKKKAKKEIALVDLLGDTINEDSQDEEWSGSKEGLFDADSDSAGEENLYEELEDIDEGESENDDEAVEIMLETMKKATRKPAKTTEKVDRLEQIIKRMPQAGGVKKNVRKPAKKTKPLLPKNSVLLAAAKEVAKPLSKTTLTSKGVANKKKGRKNVK